MSTAESLWHTIPRGRDQQTGELLLSAAVTPVSTAADAGNPQPTPMIWHNWPGSVMTLHYRLDYRRAGTSNWDPNLATLILLSKPNESLWEAIFPEISTSTIHPAVRQPAIDSSLPATTHPARSLANNILALYGAALVEQTIRAENRAGAKRQVQGRYLAVADRIRESRIDLLQQISVADYRKPDERADQEIKTCFADWVRNGLKSTNPSKALVGERNLYRLSARPYDNLADFVFRVILNSLDASACLPGASVASSTDSSALFDDFRTQLVKTAVFHARCQPPSIEKARDCQTPNYNWAQKISLLDNYPNLLRELGLVLDFKVNGPTPALPPGAEVRVVPLDQNNSPIAAESSVTRLEGDTFRPALNPTLPNGAVALDQGDYELVQVDVDGAALKLLQAGDSAARSHGRYESSRSRELLTQSTSSLPSMRNAGVGLFRSEHATKLITKMQNDQANRESLQQGKEVPPLDALGLVRGYIPEVREATSSGGEKGAKPKPWRQLMLRTESFKVTGYRTLDYPASHAIMRWAATTTNDSPSGQTPTKDFHIHEALLHWRGWSIAVPLPFSPMPQDNQSCSTQEILPIRLTSAIPDSNEGKLLPLRFGTTYEMRIRTMNMACEVSPDTDDVPSLKMDTPFCRFEPVAAPSVLLEAPVNRLNSPGEGVELLLVRTSNADDEGGPSPIRTIVPPRATLEMAELLGFFDGGRTPFNAGSFDAVKLVCHQTEDGRDYGDFPSDAASGNALYQVPTEEPPSGLYLPDPLAEYLVAELEDMTRGGVTVKAFDPMPFYPDGASKQWPRGVRYQIELMKSDDLDWGVQHFKQRRFPPYHDETVTRFVIGLPPAWKVILRLRSGISPDKTRLMAVEPLLTRAPQYLNRMPRVAESMAQSGILALDLINEVAKNTQDVSVDMLTPGRELTLIHAVAKPLFPPAITRLCATRELGETGVELSVSVEADRKSTGKIDIKAIWEEWMDDPNLDSFAKRPGNAQVGSIEIPEEPEAGESMDSRVPIRSSPEEDPTQYVFRQGFPDTIHRFITYFPVATSRFQRFFRNQDNPERFQFEGTGTDRKSLHILSTRRPPAPDIAYVVPLFDWTGEKSGDHAFTSTRCGGGLRIYLRRPWYESGQNEKIGVVLWGEAQTQQDVAPVSPANSCVPLSPATFADDQGDALLRHYVTRWGADPERSDLVSTLAPTSSMFVHETIQEDDQTWECGVAVHGLSLEEIEPELSGPGTFAAPVTLPTNPPSVAPVPGPPPVRHPVSVITYDPRYDSAKQLWYCDMFLSKIPAYSCFIRLALVRYQAYALRHAECSHVSLAAFALLPANRSVTVSRSTAKHSVDVAVRGTRPGDSALSIADSQRRNEFDLIVEHALHNIAGPLHWQEDTRLTVSIAPSSPQDDPSLLCKTTVPFKQPRGKKRLIIKEYEWKNSDVDPSSSDAVAPVRRLVFADVLALPDL